MAITVADLLNIFEDLEVIAGHSGLNRGVSTVSVMDAPDIHKWMKGGEFLITTAYVFRDNPQDLSVLIKNLEQAGASALGIKLGRFIEDMPVVALEIAEKLHYPIIYIPHKYAFTDIINPVLSRIVDEKNRLLTLSENIHTSFTKLVIEGGDAQHIVDTLAELIDREVAYYNTVFKKTFYSSNSDLECNLKELSLEELIDSQYCYPLKDNQRLYGYIIAAVDNDNMEEILHIAIEHAATVLTLDYQKMVLRRQIESRYRDLFIQDLIGNNIRSMEEIDKRASFFGWQLDTGMLVVLIDIDDYKLRVIKAAKKEEQYLLEATKESIFHTVIQMFHNHLSGSMYTSYSDVLVYLVRMEEDTLNKQVERLTEICDRLRELIIETGFTVTIGIGDYYDSAMDIHKSYKEAQKAIKLARLQYKGNKTVFYSSMGAYRLLGHILGTDDAEEFCRSYLGEIIAYDNKNNGELLLTLACIMKNDWNLKLAASDLYIHYNTIKYRYKKICSLLNINNLDAETKLNLALAIKLMQMND